MRRLLVVTAMVLVALPLRAHDLFLTLRTFFVPANSAVEVHALNGTFARSVSVVARDRMREVTVLTPAGAEHPNESAWADRDDTSVLRLRTGGAGTYVVGVSTLPRVLRLESKQFNEYLRTEGVPSVLEARRRDHELDTPARERYSKHVKALLQVGETRTETYQTALGHPAELVPLANPYSLRAGPRTVVPVRALVGGQPAVQLVLQFGGRDARGERFAPLEVTTDASGVARIPVVRAGRWYVKFISMVRLAGDTSANYESRWATLTFEMR